MGNKYTFRVFDSKINSDLKQLAYLVHNYYVEQNIHKYSKSISDVKRFLTKDKDGKYYIFKNGDEVVGFYKLCLQDELGLVDPFLYIELIYIKVEYRSTALVGYMYALMVEIQIAYGVDRICGDILDTTTNMTNLDAVDGQVVSHGVQADLRQSPLLQQLRIKYFKGR